MKTKQNKQIKKTTSRDLYMQAELFRHQGDLAQSV
jgi:hypothetical protein